MAEDLCLNLQNGTKLFVPNRLDSITTYVVLEQERWFEKEWGFIPHLLQPGMTVLDIGANLGVYGMAMAKTVGPTGHVYAYEPTSETRARLERSKAVNEAENLVVIGSALSDTEREGRIVFGESSELNRLGDDSSGRGEAVHLTSLDLEAKRHDWGAIDFIKMDAEGEEVKIIAGGKSVFEIGSPIVMFEIKSEDEHDPRIANQLLALSYELYRLLPDEEHLVPFAAGEIDPFELNLFAIKPDKAEWLEARGLLVRQTSGKADAGDWTGWISRRPYRTVSTALFSKEPGDDSYGLGLNAFAEWRNEALPIAKRYAHLIAATAHFRAARQRGGGLAEMLSLARVEADLGFRQTAYRLCIACAQAIDAGNMPQRPFVPPSVRYEELEGELKGWTVTSCLEAVECLGKYSGYYSAALGQLDWMTGTRFGDSHLERRRALSAIARGKAISLNIDLRKPSPDHLNAEVWAKLIG